MSDDKADYRINHHVVYSVKGGCGKTTFSLKLLLTDMLWKNQKGRDGQPRHSDVDVPAINYYLDIDFLGTSIHNLMGNKPCVMMNDLIFNLADVRDLNDNNEIKVEGMRPGDAKYIIPSSHLERDKERFHVERRNTPLLRYDEFFHEINGIVDKIKLREKTKGVIDGREGMYDINFIYDMPPNADGYTESLFEFLVKCAEHGDKVFLYLVFNNPATLHSDVDWLNRFMGTEKPACDFKVYLVENDIVKKDVVTGGIAASMEDTADKYMQMFCRDVKHEYIKNEFYDSVYVFNYSDENAGWNELFR